MAGPIVVAAVILGDRWPAEIPLDDSKRLDEKSRERAYEAIRAKALAWRALAVAAEIVDRDNVLRAIHVQSDRS